MYRIFVIALLYLAPINCIIKPALVSNKGPISDDYIKQFLPPKCTILEAGAHNGNDTVKLSELLPGCTIYAFEPVPDLFDQLVQNTKSYLNIHCFKIALTDFNGEATFYVSNGLDHGSSSLLKPHDHLYVFPKVQFNKVITVQTKTLDKWALENRVEKIDFLRLDMQGCEPRMLQVSSEILKTVKVIYTEVNTVELYKNCILYPEFNKWLQELGFTLVREEVGPEFGGDALFVRL